MTDKKLRCAIYTRKSSEEGLEQGFNSLHAQREACEAYVLSQAGEGWSPIKTAYDDGGFSGGSMERPGLKALLADIDAGRIDVVVVYKVDRLTRSLGDFARIVEAFDAKGVSFVSVTQAFNTTTSMGRLTLNVLLSFAQFEREVTGERIRDKIAASKKKGMWMGGLPPLGYDSPTDPLTRALVVNQAEAITVRLIFQKYLELGSVQLLMRWLMRAEIVSKRWTTRKGKQVGGLPFYRGALYHLLNNPTYIGMIPHRDQSYPGAHPSIVDRELFDKVQSSLKANAVRHKDQPRRVSTMALRGLIFDVDGAPMTPTFTHKRSGKLYRYYVSQGADGRRDIARRVGARQIEKLVADLIERITLDQDVDLKAAVAKVEIHSSTVQIVLRTASIVKRPGDPIADLEELSLRLKAGERIAIAGEDTLRATLPWRVKRRGGQCMLIDEKGRTIGADTRSDQTLIKALRSAHRMLAELTGQTIGQMDPSSWALAPKSYYDRSLCRLAFLAPDIQTAILEGRQPGELALSHLMAPGMPIAWVKQRSRFGFDEVDQRRTWPTRLGSTIDAQNRRHYTH